MFAIICIGQLCFYYKQKSMQQINKNSLFFSKLENNNSSIFGKRSKRKKSILNSEQAVSNPIYRALKVQKNATSILSLILGAVQRKQSTVLAKIRQKSLIHKQPNQKNSYLFRKRNSAQNLQLFKERASKILNGTKKIADQLSGSKRRISILDRFNKRVDKYCSFLPENPQEQEQNQSNIANDKLIKLCKQTFFPAEDLHRRANSLMHYSQPIIPLIRLKKLKTKYKIIGTTVPTSESEPLKRQTKTQPQQ